MISPETVDGEFDRLLANCDLDGVESGQVAGVDAGLNVHHMRLAAGREQIFERRDPQVILAKDQIVTQ